MGFKSRRQQKVTEAIEATPVSPPGDNLLVVEPDALLRWSLVTYFSKWFNVFAVATTDAGVEILDEESINAVIVSDVFDASEVQRMERMACDCNPAVRIIRVVTSLRSAASDPYASAALEKPFELSALADLLRCAG